MSTSRPTLAQAASLPPTLRLEDAARMLGIGRSTAYLLAAQDALPVPVLRIGRSYRVPTAPMLALLGLTPATAPRALADGEEPPPRREEPS